MISAKLSPELIEDWVQEAVFRGATLLVGGKRHGAVVEATLLENVPSDCHVACDEVFGPVMILNRHASFKDAVAKVNDSKCGLQAGVFRHDMEKALHAFEHFELGIVVWNHVPSIRVDAQPYGGVKDSDLGREGVRYAMKRSGSS